MTNRKSKSPYKPVYAAQPGKCAGCERPIYVGQHIRRGLAGVMWHPTCRRLKIRVGHQVVVEVGSPIGKACGGCRSLIDDGEVVVHRLGVPYHRECR